MMSIIGEEEEEDEEMYRIQNETSILILKNLLNACTIQYLALMPINVWVCVCVRIYVMITQITKQFTINLNNKNY